MTPRNGILTVAIVLVLAWVMTILVGSSAAIQANATRYVNEHAISW